MKRATILLAAGASLFATVGCDSSRRAQTIDGMRVLAIQADPPTARPGDKIRLEALVVNGKENPAVDLTWYACTLEFEECAEAAVPGEGIVLLGSGPIAVVEVPLQAFAGDTLVFWLDAKDGGARERSIKGVYVRPANEQPNNNPQLDLVRFGALDLAQGEVRRETRVSVRASSTTMMSELWKESGEPASEDVQITTFVTAGDLVDPSGTGASGELYFQSPAKNGRVGTWIVVNDDRGGVDWFEHWISVKGKPE